MAGTVKKPSSTALLLGCGYVGKAMIAPLRARGFDVIGTGRDHDSAEQIEALGARGVLFDGTKTDALLGTLGAATHVITSIPPNDKGDPVMTALGGDIRAFAPNLRWSAYLSATSVYGDRDGQWAFEDELLFPVNARGRQRIEAELSWLESEALCHVFRLAGIYGPGRSPFGKIKSGKARAVIKDGHVVNRIHLDDIVSALLLSMDAPDPGQVYNLADGHPAPPQDVLDFAADLIGAQRPKRVDHDSADISDMARSFYRETKRVCAKRAKKRLGWTPKFADYKAGLRSIVQAENISPVGVTISGYILVPGADRQAVAETLAGHITATRAEPGCLAFDVTAHPDIAGRYEVYERFNGAAAFAAHKARIKGTLWEQASRNAERHYSTGAAQNRL